VEHRHRALAHEVGFWKWAHEEAGLVKAAEKKGKIIRPRLNGGREEDEIERLPSPTWSATSSD
jgi:hypothetical protein